MEPVPSAAWEQRRAGGKGAKGAKGSDKGVGGAGGQGREERRLTGRVKEPRSSDVRVRLSDDMIRVRDENRKEEKV